jgi:AcrR family transcriptional regulator
VTWPIREDGSVLVDARLKHGEADLTERQKAVLDAALSLLVESGDSLTMTDVARRASCSKETLYKWFGGRDGLLTATVQWQASKVRAVGFDRAHLDISKLSAGLKQFAADWLTVISGQTSIALNRIAISHAGSEKARLGAVVLANGRFAMGERLKPLLDAARDAGLLAFDDSTARPAKRRDNFSPFSGRARERIVRPSRLALLAPQDEGG